jgi:hypothetical protein
MKYRRSLSALGLIAMLGLSLSACGSTPAVSAASTSAAPAVSSPSASPVATSTAARVEKPTPTPTPSPKVTTAQIGDVAVNGGIQIQVTSVVASPTVTLNTSSYRSGSGYESYEDVPAQSGGKYIIVTSVVTNNSHAPIDLTCSFPIEINAFNLAAQLYSPIEDNRKIKGNPECNAQLQPGFESPMIWAFMVPDKTTIIAAMFAEVDFSSHKKVEPTIISFGAGF